MNMRLSIKLKLALSFAVVIVLSGAMAVVGITNLAGLDETLQELVRGPMQRLELVQSMDADLLLQNRAEKNILLADNTQDLARYENEEQAVAQQLQQHRGSYFAIATTAGKEKMALFARAYQQLLGV